MRTVKIGARVSCRVAFRICVDAQFFFLGKNSKRSIRNIFLDISEERHYSALCLKKSLSQYGH